ncbi:MAG: DUF4386 domain-containing protein [Saonia sp.]
MKSIKKTGRIVGLLFLFMILTGATGTYLRGLSTSLMESENFLSTVFENSMQMKVAILLDLIAGAIGVGISIALFPVLKQFKKSIAFWYFALWIIGFTITIASNITHLSLLSLSQEFVNTGIPDTGYFKTLGALKVEEYYWAHFLILILYSLGSMVLYSAFLKTRLIPRILAIWFIVSVGIVFTVSWLQIFDYSVSFMFYGQNGIHLIVLTLWLLVKGFNPKYMENIPTT